MNLNRHLTACSEMEERRFKLQEDRLVLELERDIKMQEKVSRAHENESRRLKLKKKRIAMEIKKGLIEKAERQQVCLNVKP